MNHQHQLKTLSQGDNGYVGYCGGCQSYNVAFKNALFILTETELSCYRDVMNDRTAMQPFFTTHGKEWLLKTPMHNYFMMFSDEEINELLKMIDEAMLLREVDQILHSTHRLG